MGSQGIMYRFLVLSVFLALSQLAYGDSDPPPAADAAALYVTPKGNFLGLTLEVPVSAAILLDSKTPTVANKIEQLTGVLKYTYGIFSFPAKAACYRKHLDVTSSDAPGVVANWQFDCKHPEHLDRIGTQIFSLMNLHSIEAVINPDGQGRLWPDAPSLRLDQE